MLDVVYYACFLDLHATYETCYGIVNADNRRGEQGMKMSSRQRKSLDLKKDRAELNTMLQAKKKRFVRHKRERVALGEKLSQSKEVVEAEKMNCLATKRLITEDSSITGSLHRQLRGVDPESNRPCDRQ